MNIIFNDEQTLCKWPNGLTLEVNDMERYNGNGFWYELFTLDCSAIDDELYVVKKCVSDTEFDTFVCYKPYDIEFGGRDIFPFLFNEDESYADSLTDNDGVVFAGKVVGIDAEVDIMGELKPGNITEYQAPDDALENPFIFALEAINEQTGESFISYVQGCRVNQKEVEFL